MVRGGLYAAAEDEVREAALSRLAIEASRPRVGKILDPRRDRALGEGHVALTLHDLRLSKGLDLLQEVRAGAARDLDHGVAGLAGRRAQARRRPRADRLHLNCAAHAARSRRRALSTASKMLGRLLLKTSSSPGGRIRPPELRGRGWSRRRAEPRNAFAQSPS